MRRLLVTAAVLAVAVGALLGVSGASAGTPVATASKVCSAYAREHYGDVTARTPGGIKCLGPGEYCSHRRGYAKAYRRAGFRCNSKGRLERR